MLVILLLELLQVVSMDQTPNYDIILVVFKEILMYYIRLHSIL